MLEGHINILAVLVAALINMAIGAVWYSPFAFGRPWSKMIGRKMEDMKSNAGLGYAVASVGSLIESYVLAHAVYGLSLATSLKVCFWLWLAFIGVTMAIGTVFAGRRKKLWAIDSGYFLVVLLIQGVLLSSWR
ncbi:MAG: hypothetical protein NVS1B7_0430 [Candidatus Saccharimonadales bacterium]